MNSALWPVARVVGPAPQRRRGSAVAERSTAKGGASYTMFLPDGTPVRTAQTPTQAKSASMLTEEAVTISGKQVHLG